MSKEENRMKIKCSKKIVYLYMIISLDNLIFAKWALEEENILMLADKNKS